MLCFVLIKSVLFKLYVCLDNVIGFRLFVFILWLSVKDVSNSLRASLPSAVASMHVVRSQAATVKTENCSVCTKNFEQVVHVFTQHKIIQFLRLWYKFSEIKYLAFAQDLIFLKTNSCETDVGIK